MARLILCVSVILMLLMGLCETSPLYFCCTRYHENPVPEKVLKYYTIQEDTGYCNIKAVIFKTIKNKLLCANPDSMWVQMAMESVPSLTSKETRGY